MSDKIKVYFLGSGKIAVPILKVLNESPEIELMGVGTQLDRPAGRKKQLHPTPVGEFGDEQGLAPERIPNVNAEDFICKLESLAPDFVVVVSFGQILRQQLLDLPRVCCLNVHASLLPKYRGASPINAAIINGESSTGVAFMEMERGLDTGAVYSIQEVILDGSERADSLEDDLGNLAADNVVSVLQGIISGEIKPEKQDDSQATLTRKIKKADGHINWAESAVKIEAMVRGYYPWPGAVFSLKTTKKQLNIHITKARIISDMQGQPGEVLQADKKGLIIACGFGALELLEIVPQGKREMTGAAFLNGYPLEKGTVVGS
jgi:methionyl-tRNA formyltransferase